jgi:hypothetical protein
MNKHIAAAQLRAFATRTERLAWQLEKMATLPDHHQAPLLDLVNDQRKLARAMRRRADKMAPKKVKA